MMRLSVTSLLLTVLAFVTLVLGAPVPIKDLDQHSSDSKAQAPPHWMNIRLHRLDEPEVPHGSQKLVGHDLWLRGRELEELERREFEFDTSIFRVGTVVLK